MFELNDIKHHKQQLKSDNIKELLDKILTYIKTITNADGGTVYLVHNDNLVFNTFQNDTLEEDKIYHLQRILKDIKIPIKKNSQVLAVESFINSSTIIIDDIYSNDLYDFHSSKEFDTRFSYTTNSILSTPLINFYTNEKIGVLQLINKKDDSNKNIPFTNEDKKIIYISSYLITLNIIYTQDLISRLKEANMNLEYKVKQRTRQLEETQQKLIDQANKDPMTNLYNRRYFSDVIKNIMQISRRQQSQLTLLMIDIDNFKSINDTYGHDVGDTVITTLANIFHNTIRTSDIAIRFGGEEFIIILPNTTTNDAINLANKIRLIIQNNILKIKNIDKLRFTVSIGVSKIDNEDEDVKKALIKADKALYISKKQGKNQVNILV